MTPAERPLLVGGHRPFAVYRQVLLRLAPGLVEHLPRPVPSLLADHGPLTTRELAEIHGVPPEVMLSELEALASAGQIEKRPVRGGELWDLIPPV